MTDNLEELRKAVKEKKRLEEIEIEKRHLKEELDKGTVKGFLKKSFKESSKGLLKKMLKK